MRAPHRVTGWVRDFAARVHGFYRDCRVISDDAHAHPGAALARVAAAQVGLANALGILGVGAPDEMARLDEPDAEGVEV